MPAIAQFLRVNPRTIDNFAQSDGAPRWYQYNITYKMFSSGASPANYDLVMPRGVLIQGAFIRNRQNWTGGSVSAATLAAGTTSSATDYIAATTVFTGAPATLVGKTLVPGTFVATTAPASVRVQLATTTDTPDHLTAGYADVFLLLSAVPLYING